jgi:hypothetical protein
MKDLAYFKEQIALFRSAVENDEEKTANLIIAEVAAQALFDLHRGANAMEALVAEQAKSREAAEKTMKEFGATLSEAAGAIAAPLAAIAK